ncbi:MAG: glycosyltransferase family 2 protein [Candidatus Moranbacteria bacterium]|nr:glycosyltransferase family 2 protein [Candidatus Moranbacteria bacterium]NTW75563.1 glycosyltransferase family 2 protein [Candidatus Moranbacteria bacterium]
MKLIVNMPGFNEEDKIADTIRRVPRQIDGIDEIIIQVVDDGSKDRTVEESKKGGADLVISHDGNRGLGVMFRTMRQSAIEQKADILVNIDADGQFDPEDIKQIIKPILEHKADIVIADRFSRSTAKNIPFLKDKLNRLGAWLVARATGKPVVDLTCGFRAHNREAILRLSDPTGFTYTQETIIDAIGKNLKLTWIPVVVTYHEGRKSRVVKTVWKYVSSSARIIVRAFRDIQPMKFFSVPGLVFMAAAVVWFFFLKGRYPLTTLAFFLVGIQFLVFGLIADMIKSSRSLNEEILYRLRKNEIER